MNGWPISHQCISIPVTMVHHYINAIKLINNIVKTINNIMYPIKSHSHHLQNQLESCRYSLVPICNMMTDQPLFISDVFYSRHLTQHNHVIWCSPTNQPDLGGKHMYGALPVLSLFCSRPWGWRLSSSNREWAWHWNKWAWGISHCVHWVCIGRISRYHGVQVSHDQWIWRSWSNCCFIWLRPSGITWSISNIFNDIIIYRSH